MGICTSSGTVGHSLSFGKADAVVVTAGSATLADAAATAICNVGPGLGDVIGPAGNFSTLPDAAKWMLSAGMLLGRLEMFTILVLFSRTFWRG